MVNRTGKGLVREGPRVSDDVGELPDGDVAQDGDDCDDGCVDDEARNT
jgi:hypothetical protein